MSRLGWRRGGPLAAAVVALSLLFGAATTSAYADDLSNKRKQAETAIAQNAAEQDAIAEQLEGLSVQAAQVASELYDIQNVQLPAAQAKLDAANAALEAAQREQRRIADQLADAQTQEATLNDTIATTQAEQDEIRKAIGQMARDAYRGGGDMSSLSVILDASTTEDFVERYSMASTAQRAQEQVLTDLANAKAANLNAQTRLVAVRETIEELKAAADQKVAEAAKAQQDAADAKAEIQRLEDAAAAKQASIQQNIADYQAQQAALDAARAEMEADLAAIIEAQRKAAATQGSTATPGTALPGAWFANPSATNPMYVTSEYGMRFHPVLHIWRLHAGIDLRDYCGKPVYAGRDGTVVWTKYRAGYGNQVMLDHGWVNGASLMSSYNHMQGFAVSAGQHVTAGQLLGYAGNTGTSSACHLHFEVYINGATTNPRPYLGI